jgi:general secretion pathway protein E
VIAQRLIRRVCSRCSVEGHLNPDQVLALGLKVPVERRDRLAVRWGEGCAECRFTGLLGRSGVFEMLDVGKRVRQLINSGRDANEIHNAGRIEGMESLRDAAVRKLADGVTTFEEIVRVTADSE